MSNVYVVTNESGSVELSNLSKVAAFLGEKKVSKKDIEEGKYPMVAIMDANTEPVMEDLDAQYKADFAKEEAEQEAKAFLDDHMEIIHVGDAPKGEVVDKADPTQEPTMEDADTDDSTGFLPDPELDDHTKEVLAKIEQAINDTPEDNQELFDAVCELEDAIQEGTPLTNKQAVLLTSILTGEFNTPVLTNKTVEETPVDDTEYPEVGDFKDEKAMKKFIKGLSDASLEEWCILEGAEWKHNDHESINRMRMAMAIKAKHFPSTVATKSKKSKSKYAQYSTEDLVQMALDNDVEVSDDKGDARILRMYTIMALRKAGIIE